jgi:putative ABC transport system permease protein
MTVKENTNKEKSMTSGLIIEDPIRKNGLRDNGVSALRALAQNWLRSTLTLTGIVIGVLAIVTLVAILQGVKAEISRQVEGLGANLVLIVPGKLDENGQPNPMAVLGISPFTEKDIELLRQLPGVAEISPIMFVSGSIEREKRPGNTAEKTAFVVATNLQGLRMNPSPLLAGRYYREEEADQNVCVLAEKPYHDLFGDESALWKRVRILEKEWRVVGVLGSPGNESSLGNQLLGLNNLVYLPVRAAKRELPKAQINRIALKTDYSHPADKLVGSINTTLLEAHKNREDFGVLTQKKALALVIKFISMAQSLLVLVSAISLFVAGIGIMNIMLVTVTERTREIGVRKTVGARKIDIFAQFLIEAVVLSLLGGGIGLLLSAIICGLIARFSELTPLITPPVIGLALLVCSVVGVLFGVMPALRAANLNPIDALRHE